MKTWNCNEARQISIVDYLAKLDIKPQSIKGGNHWYLSPLREERTPSFKVNTRLNLWYDHGTGEGGNFIDLAIRLHSCTVEELLSRLSNDDGLPLFISPPLSAGRLADSSSLLQDEPKLVIESVRPLVSAELTQYLAKRGINAAVGATYCKEVSFTINRNTYEAVGFANRSDGYELRNDWFKGSSSPKDITFLDNGSKSVCVLEGFMDFLSLLELGRRDEAYVNFLVLNSVSMVQKSIPLLSHHDNVFLLLDRDEAGRAAAQKLEQAGISGIDASPFYNGYKDINEYLLSGQ
jgi:DNA primase